MKIGVCTGGGDCPGLNAAIMAIVKSAHKLGHEIIGIRDSLTGLLTDPIKTRVLALEDVDDILTRGGTILGTDNSGNPYKDLKTRDLRVATTKKNFEQLGLDCLIVIGGEGTQGIAAMLSKEGLPIIGIPKTIDNDLPQTERTIGFDSAVNTVRDATEKLQSTAESHDRIMVLEVMGRDSGHIALHGGLAGGAHVILIPEIPFQLEAIKKVIKSRSERNIHYSVIIVAEGAFENSLTPLEQARKQKNEGLPSIGHYVAKILNEATKMETRVTVLGHIQRGGSPTSTDRIFATRLGSEAVKLACEKQFGVYLGQQDGGLSAIPYSQLNIGSRRKIDLHDENLIAAERIGICLGR